MFSSIRILFWSDFSNDPIAPLVTPSLSAISSTSFGIMPFDELKAYFNQSNNWYLCKMSTKVSQPKPTLIRMTLAHGVEYGIWLDLEDKTVDVKGKAYIRNLAYQYANIFKKAGYYVGIYCNRDWYLRLIHDDLKRDFDLWIARYPKNDTGIYNSSSSLKPTFKEVVAWQYSSKGKVPGINGNTDLNVDYDGIINLIAVNEKKSIKEIALEVKAGKWGNGEERKKKLIDAGYDYEQVRKEVNRLYGIR